MRVKVIIYFFILLMCVLRSASRRRRRRQSCSRVDCVVHSWSSWSPCSAKQCGQPGTQERRRTVHLPPICGGTACPSLVDIVPCQGNTPADCQLSPWSSWSTCSLPCPRGHRPMPREYTSGLSAFTLIILEHMLSSLWRDADKLKIRSNKGAMWRGAM